MADDKAKKKDKKSKDIDDYEPSAYTEAGEYKGNAMITIHGGMRPFGFGFRKAELIVEVIEDIKKFVDEQRVIREEKEKAKAEESE